MKEYASHLRIEHPLVMWFGQGHFDQTHYLRYQWCSLLASVAYFEGPHQ
jgi:hypothetical protein